MTLTTSALRAALAATLLAATAPAFQAPPTYHVTDLGPAVTAAFPGVAFPSSRARGLNEDGDLVGEATLNGSAAQAWIYTVEHGLAPLPLLPGWQSNVALDVSDRDASGVVTIVGGGVPDVYWDLFLGQAMLWRYSTVTGTVLESRGIGVPPGYSDSIATAVNDVGVVVGYTGEVGAQTPFTAWKYEVATQALTAIPFPARPTGVNDAGQVCGGSYRGDLFGSFVDMGAPPNMHSTVFAGINEHGSMVARVGTTLSDGAGHMLATVARWTDAGGWTTLTPTSHLTLAGAIDELDDFSIAQGAVYYEASSALFGLSGLLAPEFQGYGAEFIAGLNANQQVAGTWGHAVLLTPLGVTVIPGDVNGDVSVDLDDLCDFMAAPSDLDGDGQVTQADEAWLVARLAVFGYFPQDCNANGIYDHCDILAGTSQDCEGNGVPDECQGDCNGDGVPDICEADCNSNGVPDPCDVYTGASNDCNLNGVPDECDGGWTATRTVAYAPAVQLLQGTTVSRDMLVLDAGVLADVDVMLDVRYRTGDLTVELSHGGTTIVLLDRPGHPETSLGNGQLGYDHVLLDDEGAGGPIEDEGNFGSPFEPITSPPSFTPDQALSAFDGMPTDGIWTLRVTTHGFSPVDDLLGWGLTLTAQALPIPPCACLTLVQNVCASGPNSTGAAAVISSNYECGVAANALELAAGPVPNQPGLFFYGPAQIQVPFGNGLRCVGAGGVGVFRLAPHLASDNTLRHTLDTTSPPQAAGAITPGSTWTFQAWYRDPAAGGAAFDTSDALSVTFLP